MKKIIILSLIVIFAFSFSLLSYADVTCTIDVNNNSQKVTINGKIDVNKPTFVTLTVLDKDKTADDLFSITQSVFDENVKYFRQIVTDNKGNFSLTFTFDQESGEYPLVINYYKSNSQASNIGIIEYYSLIDIKDVLEDVNATATFGELKTLLETKYKFLSIDITDYNALSNNSVKEKAVKDMFDYKENLKTKPETPDGFLTADDARKCFEGYSAFYRLLETTSSDLALDIIERNKENLGITKLNIYKSYEKLDNEGKLSACNTVVESETITDITSLCKCFGEAVVLEVVNDLTNWKGLKPIITQNKDIFTSVKVSKYLALNDTSDVDKSVTDKKYSDFNALCKAINTAINKASQKNDSPSIGGGGGGSSKDDESSIPAYVPDTSVLEDNKTTLTFKDMENALWAKDAVEYLYKKGIVNGKTQDTFAPSDLVTREEFAKMLVGAFLSVQNVSTSNFADVNSSSWYAPFVLTAYEKGIVKGINDNVFGVGNPITREDMCTMIYRATKNSGKYNEVNKDLPFSDSASVSDYALDAIGALYSNGFVNGMSQTQFLPQGFTTRAQASQIIYNLLK